MGPSHCNKLEKVGRYGSVLWINETGVVTVQNYSASIKPMMKKELFAHTVQSPCSLFCTNCESTL